MATIPDGTANIVEQVLEFSDKNPEVDVILEWEWRAVNSEGTKHDIVPKISIRQSK